MWPLSPSSVLVPAEWWALPFPLGQSLAPPPWAQPAARSTPCWQLSLCAGCSCFALFSDFTSLWGHLTFLGVPVELIVTRQRTEQDFCRVVCFFLFFFFLLSYAISCLFQLKDVAVGLVMGYDLVRLPEKSRLILPGKGVSGGFGAAEPAAR